jgi:hypothetical protein
MRFESPEEDLLGEDLQCRGGAADEEDDNWANHDDQHQDEDGVHLADIFGNFITWNRNSGLILSS